MSVSVSRGECGSSAASPPYPDRNASNKAHLIPMALSAILFVAQAGEERYEREKEGGIWGKSSCTHLPHFSLRELSLHLLLVTPLQSSQKALFLPPQTNWGSYFQPPTPG